MDCPDCGGNHVIQIAHDVLCAATDTEAIYAFAELIVEDIEAAEALARVLVIGGEPDPWDYMIQKYRERGMPGQRSKSKHKAKTFRWRKTDPTDTAQGVEDWLRSISKGGDEHGKT